MAQSKYTVNTPDFDDTYLAGFLSNMPLTTLTTLTIKESLQFTAPIFRGWTSGGNTEPSYSLNSYSTTASPLNDVNKAVLYALSKVGSPYKYGANGENGFYDCSSLILLAYKSMGKDVPRSTAGWLSSGKQTVGKYDGQAGDVIITGSKDSPSGRHIRMITENLGNGNYKVVEAKGKKYGVVTGTYTIGSDLKNIYRAKLGIKLIKKPKI